MPKILTKEYLERTFFVPLKADKSEGVWVRPLTETKRTEIRNAALQEAGQDADIAARYMVRDTLKACLTDWKGFYDAEGREIAFDKAAVPELCGIDPEFFSGLYLRILNVARTGEAEDLKN